MLFINTLIVFFAIASVSAGPIFRYNNTTSTTTTAADPAEISGVDYATNSPSSSALVVDGITRLPTSLLAERPTQTSRNLVSAPLDSSLSDSSSQDTATREQTFQYQPLETDRIASSPPKNQTTSFQTFGNRPAVTTLTVWSTTWTTVPGQAPDPDSAEPRTSQPASHGSLPHNATSSSEQATAWTSQFSFDPVPTSSPDSSYSELSSTVLSSKDSPSSQHSQHQQLDSTTDEPNPSESTTSSNFDDSTPISSTFTTSTTSLDHPSNSDSTDLPRFSLDSSARLPEVIAAPTSQSKQDESPSNATNVPGITIVPQNPSVIFITVTDAGVTTTVSA